MNHSTLNKSEGLGREGEGKREGKGREGEKKRMKGRGEREKERGAKRRAGMGGEKG